jgi:hypothetical protein
VLCCLVGATDTEMRDVHLEVRGILRLAAMLTGAVTHFARFCFHGIARAVRDGITTSPVRPAETKNRRIISP